jgi:hypothetical protein
MSVFSSPLAIPGSAVLQQPLLHLYVCAFSSPELFLKVLSYSNLCCTWTFLSIASLCCTWTCLAYNNLCCTLKCCPVATCAAPRRFCLQQSVLHLDVSGLQQPRALPGSVVPEQPVLHLDVSVYSSLCCTWTCLAYSSRCCTGRFCLQQSLLHLDVSGIQRPVLHLDLSVCNNMCFFRACLPTAACASSKISVYSSLAIEVLNFSILCSTWTCMVY